MSDPLEEILASFFIECEELLEALMDALETLSEGSQDRETINVAFRAVHSIKGGAGAFGLDALVAFSHQLRKPFRVAGCGKSMVGVLATQKAAYPRQRLSKNCEAARAMPPIR